MTIDETTVYDTVGTMRNTIYAAAIAGIKGISKNIGILSNGLASIPFCYVQIEQKHQQGKTYLEASLSTGLSTAANIGLTFLIPAGIGMGATITASIAVGVVCHYLDKMVTEGVDTFFNALETPITKIISHPLLSLLDNSKELYDESLTTQPIVIDPLVIDLDGDGIETTTVANGTFFDHQNDGYAEQSAWVAPDDGILVHDKNNNGTIDNGNEIFGDNYTKSNNQKASSGFDALFDFDSNNDWVINANDTNFSNLKVLKGDGTLLTLQEAGITQINLSNTPVNTTDANGNTQLTTGTYTKSDGTTGNLGDFNFDSNKTYSVATDWIEKKVA